MATDDRATLLVVEDDPGLSRLLLMRLQRAGYAVVTATDAAEGKAKALADGIDLMVLDQRLPGGVSGLELYEQIRAAGRDVPTILVTAFSDEAMILQALRAGVLDFVPKTPNYLDYLLPAIERVLKQRRTERQLSASRAQLAGIIDSAMDAMLTVGPDGTVTLFNPAAEHAFRRPAAAAVGRPVEEFLPDWAALLRADVTDRDVPHGLHVCHAETQAARAGGERFPAEVSLSRAAHLNFWTCIVRDVTDRRRAEEEHFRLLVEQAARAEAERSEGRLKEMVGKLQEQAHLLELAHVIVRDNDDRVIFWNRGTTQMYGWTADEARGRNAHELLKTVFPAPLDDIRAALRRDGQWAGELVHTRKDGSTLVVASHWALHRDAGGAPVAVLEVNNDVSELKRLQEALRVADQRKDDFLAVLAHELRNPLAPIRNALHLMRLTGGNPQSLEESRSMIERQIRHMVRLIDDLLDLSRITRGKIQLRKEPTDAAAIVDAAVESSRPTIDAAGHRLHVALPEQPITIDADPMRISQVLTNLLNNAAKYTEPGGEVFLTLERQGSQAVFRVRDTGIGILPEGLPTIFEMFAQADRALNRSQGGLGIGLSLVRGLVTLHGGTVVARSDGVGKGSEFEVRLPARPSAVPAPAGPPPSPKRRRTRKAAVRRRIVIVDDNVDGANSLETLLGVLGHEVAVAHDGAEGLALVKKVRPDVIILDIGLPGMTGYEVAEQIRSDPDLHNVLLVAMTGWGKDEDRRRSLEAGFNAHLVKPVELHELEALLNHRAASPTPPA